MQQTQEQTRAARMWFGLLFGAVVVIAAAFTIVGVAVAQNSGGGSSSDTPVVVQMSLTEFAISGDLELPADRQVLVDIVNNGSAEHNLVVEGSGLRTPNMAPGETFRLDLGVNQAGSIVVFCDIAGHRAAGMEATVNFTSDASTDSTGGHGGGGGHGAFRTEDEWAALDQKMMESMLEFPAETEGIGNIPLEPTILPDGTKRFEVTAAITPWEVEPGKIVDAWTYNEMVPGPWIKVNVGDKVEVVVNNDLPLGTDVHWHGIRTPNAMDGVAPYTQDLIAPGESFTYAFTAVAPATGMYHAHHHGHEAVVNGMFAVFQIDEAPVPRGMTINGKTIPEDLEIAREIPMVTNDAGVLGFTLNGKGFPATEPYVVTEDDWLVIHYYNEGLGTHPMHLHQFPQLVFAKDGHPLESPYYADTINVAPGERYSVLVHADEAGTWVWHCHILTHVERDGEMFGMVTAVIVQPKE